MHNSERLIVSLVLAAIFMFMLTVSGTKTPTLGFAPSKQLVQKAIAFQVKQTQQQLAQQLQASPPILEITQVALKQVEPLLIEDLPTYHVRGTYSLTMKLPQQKVTQSNNPFDLYLQRQQEGKTWRLIRRENLGIGKAIRWRSYLIPKD